MNGIKPGTMKNSTVIVPPIGGTISIVPPPEQPKLHCLPLWTMTVQCLVLTAFLYFCMDRRDFVYHCSLFSSLTCCLSKNVALHPSSVSGCKKTAPFLSSSMKFGESDADISCCSLLPPLESEDALTGGWGMSLFKRSVTSSFSFSLVHNAFRRLFRSRRSLLLYASGIL